MWEKIASIGRRIFGDDMLWAGYFYSMPIVAVQHRGGMKPLKKLLRELKKQRYSGCWVAIYIPSGEAILDGAARGIGRRGTHMIV